MPDLDFAGLRGDIETATRLPEFGTVERRGNRARRRDRLGKLAIGLVTLAVLVPAGLAGLNAAPGHGPTPMGPDGGEQYRPPDTDTGPTGMATTIYAIAGLSRTSLYAALDVCRPTRTTAACNLQVVSLGLSAQDQRNPIVTGALREDPSDALEDIRLTVLSPKTLLLYAYRRDGSLLSRRITIGSGTLPNEHMFTPGPQRGDRLVQVSRYGEPSYVRQGDDQPTRLASPPAVNMPVVVTSVPVESGWWVTGTDPISGQIAVAVSHNQGATWEVRPLGLTTALSEPVLTTTDGHTAYVFLRTATGILQWRSTDGGSSWQRLDAKLPWPSSAGFDATKYEVGAIVRTDGSLLIWLENDPGTAYLESSDNGLSYRSTDGPGGRIVAVGDAYVTISDPPRLSWDARNWTALPHPPTTAPPP